MNTMMAELSLEGHVGIGRVRCEEHSMQMEAVD